MKPFIIICFFVVVIFVLVLPMQLQIRRNMQRYWDRACTGFQWRRRFPGVPTNEIRSFLDLFVEAFAFHQKRRLCFSPDDKVMDVYHALYPCRFEADAMELETLALQLSKKYGKDAAKFWREDITLGEIFEQIRVA